jgi:hypothetical protein
MAADPPIPAAPTTTTKPSTPAVVAGAATPAAVSKAVATASISPGPSAAKAHRAAVGATTIPPTAATPSAGAPAPVSTLAARRTPSAAEINQAIREVHQLVPFFTPTPKQVARVGDQVCTALDQGMTFAQVKSKISAMLGPLSWLLPSAVAAQGVRTTVNLYCPGYASKLI